MRRGGGRGARSWPPRPRPPTPNFRAAPLQSPRVPHLLLCLLRGAPPGGRCRRLGPRAPGRGSLRKDPGRGRDGDPPGEGTRALSGDPGLGDPGAGRKQSAGAARATRPAGRAATRGREPRAGGPASGRGGGQAAGRAGACPDRVPSPGAPPANFSAGPLCSRLLWRLFAGPGDPTGPPQPARRPASPGPRASGCPGRGLGGRAAGHSARRGVRAEGDAGGRRRRLAGGRRRRRGSRGFIYLPWNQSLQTSHSIMKRFTSYGCRHTQYTGGGGGGAEARPGAATDTAAAAAPAAAPAATAAAAPAIFKKHTHARSLLRSPTGASAAASQRRLLQQPEQQPRRRRRRPSARARDGGAGGVGGGARTAREAPAPLLPALRAGTCVSRTSPGRLRARPTPLRLVERRDRLKGTRSGGSGGRPGLPEDTRGGAGSAAPEGRRARAKSRLRLSD